MQLRVILQSTGVGVQHRRHAQLTADVPLVLAELFQCLDGGLKQERVGSVLMPVEERPQLLGDRQRHHKILRWNELLLLPVKPLTGRRVLTAGTAAMAATERMGLRVLTVTTTAGEMTAAGFAGGDGIQCTQLAWHQLMPVLAQKGFTKLFDDRRDVHWRTSGPCRGNTIRSAKALITRDASCFTVSVSWV